MNLVKLILEADPGKFRKAVQDCNNPSHLSKLLEVLYSLQDEIGKTSELKLVANLISILEEEIDNYSKEEKGEEYPHKGIPFIPWPVLVLLQGESLKEIHYLLKN